MAECDHDDWEPTGISWPSEPEDAPGRVTSERCRRCGTHRVIEDDSPYDGVHAALAPRSTNRG